MKIKFLIIFFTVIFQTQNIFAQDLKAFLQNCGWGIVTGASIGIVTLAFSDKPSESWNNVAKGASLGLYAGIGYGVYQMNKPSTIDQRPDFAMIPDFKDGKIEGVHIVGTALRF
ncbi:MAG: hypothetical protein ACXVCY_00440 [Pseudobdellovibrionaceae bacterium]